MTSQFPEIAHTDDAFPAPFPKREHHTDECPGCGHILGIHADTFGCIHGWLYDSEGRAAVDGCDCYLTLSSQHRPPKEGDL